MADDLAPNVPVAALTGDPDTDRRISSIATAQGLTQPLAPLIRDRILNMITTEGSPVEKLAQTFAPSFKSTNRAGIYAEHPDLASLAMGMPGQVAYHGTPLAWEGIGVHPSAAIGQTFNLKKIGSGEGRFSPEQINEYGAGGYFAKLPEVGEGYRVNVTVGQLPDPLTKAEEAVVSRIARNVIKGQSLTDAYYSAASDIAKKIDPKSSQWTSFNAALDRYHPDKLGMDPRVYRVEAPENAEMMHWNKSLSSQSEGVRSGLLTLGFKDPNQLGGSIYRELEKREGSSLGASQRLSDAGIPGHLYDTHTGHENMVIYDPARAPITLAARSLAEARKENPGFAFGGKVNGTNKPLANRGPLIVISPSGELGTLDPSDWTESTAAQGYRIATPAEVTAWQRTQKYGGLGQTLAAAGEGALEGVIGPLGPAAERAFGVPAEDILARREEHPIAHGAGQVAGIAGSLLAPVTKVASVPGLIAKAGRGVEAGVEAAAGAGRVGRVLGGAAMGATETALYAGEDVFSRALLGDPNLTAEKAVAEVGIAGALGGALGAVPRLLGAALGPVGEKLEAKGVAAARTKALLEAEQTERSLVGALGGETQKANRQVEWIIRLLGEEGGGALTPENRAALQALKGTPEYAAAINTQARHLAEQVPEQQAVMAGARGALEEFQAGKAAQVAARETALTEPGRLGTLLKERVLERYGSRAILGELAGKMAGAAPGIGPLAGISFGYMKDVLKRILKDPSMLGTAGRFLQDPIQTLSAIAGLSKFAGATDKAIASGIGNIFAGEGAAVAAEAAGAVAPKNFPTITENWNDRANNGERLSADLSGAFSPIQPHTPAHSDAMQQVVIRGTQALGAATPKPLGPALPLDPPYVPAKTEKQAFDRVHALVNKPTDILRHVADGTLTPTHLQIVQVVYPNLLQDMRAKTMERLVEEKAKGRIIPYKTRLALSHFLGQPLDSSMLPQHIAANQAAYAMPQHDAAPPKPPGPSPMTLASRSMTAMERTANRRG